MVHQQKYGFSRIIAVLLLVFFCMAFVYVALAVARYGFVRKKIIAKLDQENLDVKSILQEVSNNKKYNKFEEDIIQMYCSYFSVIKFLTTQMQHMLHSLNVNQETKANLQSVRYVFVKTSFRISNSSNLNETHLLI